MFNVCLYKKMSFSTIVSKIVYAGAHSNIASRILLIVPC